MSTREKQVGSNEFGQTTAEVKIHSVTKPNNAIYVSVLQPPHSRTRARLGASGTTALPASPRSCIWLTQLLRVSGGDIGDGDLRSLDNDGVSHGRFNLTTLAAWRWLQPQAINRAINESRPEDACQESMRTLSRA